MSLKVKLPNDVHVQSDKPDDPALIATALTLTSVPGVVVDRIVYPAAAPFQQAGRATPLAVFGPEFVIDVHFSIAPSTPADEVTVPAQLRYQACNERVCFAPSRASVKWVVNVQGDDAKAHRVHKVHWVHGVGFMEFKKVHRFNEPRCPQHLLNRMNHSEPYQMNPLNPMNQMNLTESAWASP